MLKELRELLVGGKNTQAVQMADRLVQTNPTQADALHLSAIAFMRVGQFDRAAELFERALMITPEDPNLHMNLAQLHLYKGELATAKDGFKAASMLNPNLSAAHASLGNLAAIGGDRSGASELFLTALRADANSLPALLGRGHLLLDEGNVQEALKVGEKVCKIAPRDARSQLLFGRALLASGQTAFAKQAISNATAIKPNFAAAHILLARAHLSANDLAAADAAIQTAAQLAPNELTMLLVRAELYMRSNRADLSAQDLEAVLHQQPEHEGAFRARIGLHLRAGEVDIALSKLKEACLAQPQNWMLHHQYIGTLLELNQVDEALAQSLSWTVRAPDFAPAWMHLAAVEESQNRLDQARDAAEKAHAIDAGLAQASLILARARLRAGRLNEAQTVLNTLLAGQSNPEQRLEALALRGRVFDALGQRNEAISTWQEAAALEKNGRYLPKLDADFRKKMPPVIPPLPTQENFHPSIVFLAGLPASGVESIAWWLANAPGVVVTHDRFGLKSESQRFDFFNSVSNDRLSQAFDLHELEHIRSRYLKGLRRMLGAQPKLVVDCLPVLDARQARVMRAALPEARWLFVQRDVRDVLLGALSHNNRQLKLSPIVEAAKFLKVHHEHFQFAASEARRTDLCLDFDGAKADYTKLDSYLSAFLDQRAGEDKFHASQLTVGGLNGYFAAKRWQAFEAQLSDAFKVF
jgi:tetratricopeptide (TPR) repeat protein